MSPLRYKTMVVQRAEPRPGFTLVELLVVIAIIGVLVGLLLPAVQAAREAARRMSCSNNLAQVALALHNFEFSNEHFPAGVTNATGPIGEGFDGDGTSFLVRLLPFVEQQGLHDRYDYDAGVFAAANREVRQSEPPTYRCPSDPQYMISPIAGDPLLDESEMMDIDDEAYSSPRQGVAITNYAGCYHDSESPIDVDNNGVLFLNSAIRYGDIYDGSSNTIAIGEMVNGETSIGWVSGRGSLRNTGALPNADRQQRNQALAMGVEDAPIDPAIVGGFGSHHPGGGNFALASGAIRFISNSIDPVLYKYLANRTDGANMATEW